LAALGPYVALSDVSEALFLAVLLHISCGYSITRDTLGAYRGKVIGLPLLYCVLILAVDMFIMAQSPAVFYTFDPIESGGPDSEPPPSVNAGSYALALVVFLAAVSSLACWILAVVFIFEFVKLECAKLERAVAAAEANGMGNESGGQTAGLPPSSGTFEVVGDPDSADGGADGGAGDEPDPDYEVKTVEDAITHRDKMRLLRRFRNGVYGYAAAYGLVIIFPAFVTTGVVPQTMLLAFNLIMWGFIAWLVWVFRLREDNPYLLIGEDGRVGGPSAALNAAQLDTELGVIAGQERGGDEAMGARLVSGPQSHMGAVDPDDITNFTLADDEEWRGSGAPSGRSAGDPSTPAHHVRPDALSMWPKPEDPKKAS